MAKNSCTFIPSKGKSLHRQLKNQFGYEMATKVFLTGINPLFIKDYGTSLTLDSEGVPTYDSLMSIPYIKNFIGNSTLRQSLNKQFPVYEDTIENYYQLLQVAKNFNDFNPNNNDYVAIVTNVEKGIKVSILDKTEDNVNKFSDLYSSNLLNRKLLDIFEPLGVTLGLLTQAELASGRVGIIDFSKVSGVAKQFSNIIRIANNMEGAQAISEEFSHLLIGIFRNESLVTRAISTLSNNEASIQLILGDKYQEYSDFHNGDLELLAEEALGHILQSNLIKLQVEENLPNKSLFQRLINFIKNAFKKFNASDVETAIIDSNEAMSYFAKKLLQGNMSIDRDSILASKREAQFNALSDIIETNIKILKEAAKTELKRGKIAKDSDKAGINTIINDLLQKANSEDSLQIALGLLNYALGALNELRILNAKLENYSLYTPAQLFSFLRKVKLNIDSYGQFIQSLRENIDEAREEGELAVFLNIDTALGIMSVEGVLAQLSDIQSLLYSSFLNKARKSFAEYLKPIMGESVIIKSQTYTVKDLLREAPGDIRLLDRWLDSMEESSDIILKAFDKVYKQAQDNTRLNAIEAIREIQKLQEEAEKAGITDFEWMFEVTDDGAKTGNYIQETNYGLFEKDREEFEDYLDDKYGKNPTGDTAKAKIDERNQWYADNATSLFGTAIPKGDKYKNTVYQNLTDKLLEMLNKFLELKSKFDNKYPTDRVALYKAIQIRKDKGLRIFQSLSSPSMIVLNLKESIKDAFLEREDDDSLFGDSMTTRGLKNFDGSEYMSLPILYTNRLKNPDDLSTDVFGSMMAYAYAALNYEQIEEIIDPLEVGRAVMLERKVVETRGSKQVIERIKGYNIEAVNKIFKNESNINAKLDDFFASKLYHRYLKDEGTWDILGKQVSKNKLVGWALQASSFAQLGFNWLANLANVTTGICMQNIEAAASEYFNASELLKADKEYTSNIIGVMLDKSNRILQNKLSLFDELFDVKLDFGKNTTRVLSKNLLKRILGGNLHFIGLEAGDHWMYNRTAIAMALRKQVLLNGLQMSLWEALQVRDKYEDSNIKELNISDIKELDGSAFNVGEFGRLIATVNHGLFGIYNEEDANAANRVAMGRLLQQYRKWMKPQFNRRFGDDGYYRTFGRVLNDLIRGHVLYSMLKETLTPHEKAQVRRALSELIQWFAIWAIANFVEWPKDKDRPWIYKSIEYGFKRLAHELGSLAPTLTMPRELVKTALNPLPSSSVFIKMFNLVGSIVDPRDWNDEMKSGPYKGMSTLHKNIMKAPLPVLMEYKLMDRFLDDIDTSIDFYVRNTL